MTKLLSALFAFALFGGANINSQDIPPQNINDNQDQDNIPEDGLVVVAMNNDTGLETLRFAKINPRTCFVEKTATIDYDITRSGDALVHDAFEPGIWVVAETTFKDGRERTVTKYENGSFAFEVTPGDVTYVGKLKLSRESSMIDRPDRDALTEYLDAQADINALPNVVVPWITPYSTDMSEERSPVANCNTGPLAFLDDAA